VAARQKALVLVFLRPIMWIGSILYFIATRDLIVTILLLTITLAVIFYTYFCDALCARSIFTKEKSRFGARSFRFGVACPRIAAPIAIVLYECRALS
jgi:hypothetical protein